MKIFRLLLCLFLSLLYFNISSAEGSTCNHISAEVFPKKDKNISSRLADILRDSCRYKDEAIRNLWLKYDSDCDSLHSLYLKALDFLDSQDSPLRDENSLIQILQLAINSDCFEKAEKIRARYRLEIAMKNRPGMQAPDFSFIDRYGSSSKLSLINPDYSILLFYDPDCDHCLELIGRIQESSDELPLQIVAIYPGEDIETWDKSKFELPEKWIVGISTDPIEDDESYVFLHFPSLFFISPTRQILLKEPTLKEIALFLQSHSIDP